MGMNPFAFPRLTTPAFTLGYRDVAIARKDNMSGAIVSH